MRMGPQGAEQAGNPVWKLPPFLSLAKSQPALWRTASWRCLAAPVTWFPPWFDLTLGVLSLSFVVHSCWWGVSFWNKLGWRVGFVLIRGRVFYIHLPPVCLPVL